MDKKNSKKIFEENFNKSKNKRIQNQLSNYKNIQIVMNKKSIFNQFDNDSLDLYRQIKGGRF